MKLQIARENDSFSVQGEWVDKAHRMRAMREDLTPNVLAALEVLMAWAESKERDYSAAVGEYDDRRLLEAEIAMLQRSLDTLNRNRRR